MSMDAPKVYGIYTARFPFLDAPESKIRPVVVLSKPYGKYHTVAIAPISSSAEREAVDVALAGWRAAGLLHPSVVRTHRLTAMLQSDLISELGVLSGVDMQALRAALHEYLLAA